MKHTKKIITAVLVLISITCLSATPEDNSHQKIITVCRPELTGTGKMATFHYNYPYSITTNKDGSVEKILKLAERRPVMVREEKMVECMKTWKLAPSNRYTVYFSIGTTSDPNYISIIDSNGESLQLMLP